MTEIIIGTTELAIFSAGFLLAVIIASLWLRQIKSRHDRLLIEQHNNLEKDQQLAIAMVRSELERAQQDYRELKNEFEKQSEASRHQSEKVSELSAELKVEQQKFSHLQGVEQRYEESRLANEEITRQLQVQQARAEADKKGLQEQLSLLQDAKKQMSGEFELLANKIFEDKQQAFTAQSKGSLDATINPLKEQLQSFRKKVEDAYDKESADRNQLAGKIVELQKQTQQIGEDAINLTNALKGDNKAQGNWGEIILERLLEESGLQKGREYDVQVALKSEEGKRRNPDVIIRLPENKDIIIDSKVSLAHYERHSSCDDANEREQLLKQHVASIRAHISGLSIKSYEKLEGIRTLDFVFIFIPVEAAFMAALQADQKLFKDAYDKQIVLVSPTTLLATLRMVENIWRYEKQNKNAEKIAHQAGLLYDKFTSLVEGMADVRRQMDKASSTFENVEKRLSTGSGNLVKRVEDLRKLGAKTKKKLPAELLSKADTDADNLILEDAREQLTEQPVDEV